MDLGGQDSFPEQRKELVSWLKKGGYIRREAMAQAVLRVPREQFVPPRLRELSYTENPLPIPGENATISCVHTYCICYEALGLEEGHRFLEVGLGSGYGAALAQEVVGPHGKVVSIELDPRTYRYGDANLKRCGYQDVVTVQGDGSEGHADMAPYDRVAISAACPWEPTAVMEQVRRPGGIVFPLGGEGRQQLMLMEVDEEGRWSREALADVVYVPLRGKHGWHS